MQTENFTTTVLTAAPGHCLTQADPATPARERVIATTLALGRHDSPARYREITAAEADALRAAIAEAMAEEQEESAPAE